MHSDFTPLPTGFKVGVGEYLNEYVSTAATGGRYSKAEYLARCKMLCLKVNGMTPWAVSFILLVLVVSERLLRPREVCVRLGISYATLSRWVGEGRIRAIRTAGGKFRVPESEVRRIAEGIPTPAEVRAVIYVRVSSSDQKSDLERQVEYLTQYCSSKGYRVVDVLSDAGSGLNANRKGPLKLLDYVVNRQVDVVVITYKDRLTRFGFEYLEYFFKQHGVRVEVVFGEEPKDAYQELVEDLLAIVTSFAGKLYGLRSRKKRKLVEGFKKTRRRGREGVTSVTRTVIVRSVQLPRSIFSIFVEIEGMYRNMVEQLVLYAVRNEITSFVKLKALKYRELRGLYPHLPSHYAYTACQDASTRAKSFARLKKKGSTKKEYPEIRRVSIWLDDHLWELNGLASIRVFTHKGWVSIDFMPHKQYWRYVNRGWKLASESRIKLDKRNRQVIIYLVFIKEVGEYEHKGYLPVDVNENNVTVLVEGIAYLFETSMEKLVLGYYYRRKRIQEKYDKLHGVNSRTKKKILKNLRKERESRISSGRLLT